MLTNRPHSLFEQGVTPVPHVFSEVDLVNTPDADRLLSQIDAHLDRRQGFTVATLNLDHIVKLRARPDFMAAYAAQTFVVADGNPVVWLRRLAGQPVKLTTGADLIEPLMAMAARRGARVAFLGSTQEALEDAADILERRHPGLQVVARIAPSFGFDPEGEEAKDALRAVAAASADLCLLSLGAPKQEILAARGRFAVPGCGFVSIGAGLDFIAGHQRRAPLWMRRMALEWLWRFLSDPRRLAKRYLACLGLLPGLVRDSLRRGRKIA